jgi:cell division septation protein DedD
LLSGDCSIPQKLNDEIQELTDIVNLFYVLKDSTYFSNRDALVYALQGSAIAKKQLKIRTQQQKKACRKQSAGVEKTKPDIEKHKTPKLQAKPNKGTHVVSEPIISDVEDSPSSTGKSEFIIF